MRQQSCVCTRLRIVWNRRFYCSRWKCFAAANDNVWKMTSGYGMYNSNRMVLLVISAANERIAQWRKTQRHEEEVRIKSMYRLNLRTNAQSSAVFVNWEWVSNERKAKWYFAREDNLFSRNTQLYTPHKYHIITSTQTHNLSLSFVFVCQHFVQYTAQRALNRRFARWLLLIFLL